MNEPQTFADLQDAGNAQAQLILQAIARHANWDTGICWPGDEALAKMAKCSVRTVQTYLGKLEQDGLISRKDQRSTRGTKLPRVITLVGYEVWISALREGGKVAKPKAVGKYEQPPANLSGGPPANSAVTTGKLSAVTTGKQSAGQERLTNNQLNKSEGSNSILKSEVGFQLTKAEHPEQIAAWRRYADLVGGQKNRFIVRMIDDHGACLVPSMMPPEVGLTEKSKRMSGEAA